MILMFLALAAQQPAVATPRGFLAQVYAGYRRRDYNPRGKPDRIFAPELATAIRTDEKLAHGEVGYLDGDPLCDCQDYQKITLDIRALAQPTSRRATARVRVSLGIDTPRDLTLELARTPAGWRIADIVSTEGSLLAALRKSNAEQKRK